MRPVSVTATSSGVSNPVRLDRVPNGGFSCSIQAVVTSGATFSVERTNFDPPSSAASDPTWVPVPGFDAVTSGGFAALSAPSAYIRLNTTSVTSGGSVQLVLIQTGPG